MTFSRTRRYRAILTQDSKITETQTKIIMISSKKGFTIVELVIVIAVIAILAAVMIPTFSGIVDKANESAALQEAQNTYKLYLGLVDYSQDTAALDAVIEIDPKYGGKYVRVVNGIVQSGILRDYDTGDQYIIDRNGGLTAIGTLPGEPT